MHNNTKTMKRPLPTTTTPKSRTTALTLLLFLSASVNARKEDEDCTTLITMAFQSDADDSGGLNRSEFAQFWNELSGTSDIVDGSNALSQLVGDTYNSILCECHETWELGVQCCDDTATDDSISDSQGQGGPGNHNNGNQEIWTEISLQGFGDDARRKLQPNELHGIDIARKPNWYEKEYRKNFCEWVEDAMDEVGVELGEAVVATEAATTTTEATTVAATTTAEEATATVFWEPTAEEATATVFWEPTATSTPEVIPDPIEDFLDGTLITSTTTTTATPPATTTTTTTAATTTTTIESPKVEETFPTYAPTMGPITLSFVGSTNGKVNANSIDLDEEATHAFMRVALDVASGMDVRRQRRGRQLMKDFVEEAAVYFESVVMDVKDVECPDGLSYAAEEAACLEFTYKLTPLSNGPLAASGLAQEFTDNFYEATNDSGKLYDALVEEYPGTEIVGLGSPGKGIPLGNDGNIPSSAKANQNTFLQAKDTPSEAQPSGIPVGVYIGIALAAALLALVVMALFVKKRRRKKQQKQELNDSNLSEDLEADEVNADADNVEDWLDEDEEDDTNHINNGDGRETKMMPKSPASSLAAMGVASTVATRLSTGDTEVFMTEKQAWSKKQPGVEDF